MVQRVGSPLRKNPMTDDPSITHEQRTNAARKWMTVREMGDLLRLKKTERYWLVKKQFFHTEVIDGQMRVEIQSFERWYKNQVKYKKVDGEEPGCELREWSYSPKEQCEMLGVTSDTIYDLLKKENIETVIVDHWKRVPKKAFDAWYAGQSKYRNTEDRQRDASLEAASITMPEMAGYLGETRNAVYHILHSVNYGHFFEYITIAGRKRITKESFQRFLDGQDQYRLRSGSGFTAAEAKDNAAVGNHKRMVLITAEAGKEGADGDLYMPKYLTRTEAASMANVSQSMVTYWGEQGCFSEIKLGNLVRISRVEYENWLRKRKDMEDLQNGID